MQRIPTVRGGEAETRFQRFDRNRPRIHSLLVHDSFLPATKIHENPDQGFDIPGGGPDGGGIPAGGSRRTWVFKISSYFARWVESRIFFVFSTAFANVSSRSFVNFSKRFAYSFEIVENFTRCSSFKSATRASS